MNVRWYLIVLATALLLASCATQGAQNEVMRAAEEVAFDAAEAEGGDFSANAADVDSGVVQTSLRQQVQTQERLIIRTGDMDLVVEDTEASLAEIEQRVLAKEGWVVSSNIFQRNESKSGSITVRVPADSYDELVAEVRELAVEVRSETSDSQDVTEEFVDLSARLENLEATADRVRAFLDEARNVEEALEVNRELSRLEGDIESLKGRLQFLQQSAAFSTLTIRLTPDELSGPIEVAGWRPQGVAREALQTLIGFLQGLASLAIWSVILCLPIGLILGVPAFLVMRYGRRFWRRRRPSEEEVESS